jgi:hypothetical protein
MKGALSALAGVFQQCSHFLPWELIILLFKSKVNDQDDLAACIYVWHCHETMTTLMYLRHACMLAGISAEDAAPCIDKGACTLA